MTSAERWTQLRASRTTARDATRLLAAVWHDTAASKTACAQLRDAMAQQVTRRLRPAVPDGATLAAKSGSLFGRIRNEIGVITEADAESYAVAVLTRAHEPFHAEAAINAAMATAAAVARDPRCSIAVSIRDADVVIEGDAARVMDPASVARIAKAWADDGWPAEPDPSGFGITAPFNAPSQGPPPWNIYRIEPRSATVVSSADPGGLTRFKF